MFCGEPSSVLLAQRVSMQYFFPWSEPGQNLDESKISNKSVSSQRLA